MKKEKTGKQLIGQYLLLSSLGIGIDGINRSMIDCHSIPHYLLLLLSGSLCLQSTVSLYQLSNYYFEKKNHKKMKQLNILYQDFLKNYQNLNHTFSLEDPVEILTLYNYLLFHGYLSNQKSFTFSNDSLYNLPQKDGFDIIQGRGVCRHISSLLCDILIENGYPSQTLFMEYKDSEIIYDEDENGLSYEEILSWVKERFLNDEDQINVLEDLQDDLDIKNKKFVLDYQSKNDVSFIKHLLGNHAITYVEFDHKRYFLDSTNFHIYHYQYPNHLMDYERTLLLKPTISRFFTHFSYPYPNMISSFKEDISSLSREEEMEFVQNTKKKYLDNLDILEQFYQDNSELYQDISNELQKVKKIRR